MDEPGVEAKTFVLKTNIHSDDCEKDMVFLLQHIQGVHRVSIHPTEIGMITILGTIEPRKLVKILLINEINSEHVLEPMINQRDLPNVQHIDGKSGSRSARNLHENAMHKNGKHVMENDCHDLHCNHECCCSGKYTHYYCHGCGSTYYGYMAPRESVSIGIPCPRPSGYIPSPSAPPVPKSYPNPAYNPSPSAPPVPRSYPDPAYNPSPSVPRSYPDPAYNPSPPVPKSYVDPMYIPSPSPPPVREMSRNSPPREQTYDHPLCMACSSDNPTCCFVFFLFCFLFLLILAEV